MLTRDEIIKFLIKYKQQKQHIYNIKKLGIFGSYARGEAKENSDIDIVVDFSKPDLFNQIGIMQDIQEYFKKQVDVIALWKHINPKLKKRIERDVIYV